MIVLKLDKALMLILEPGNIDKLQLGDPIIKDLKQFIPELSSDLKLIMAWTPDCEWLAAQIKAGANLVDALKKSLTRDEVHVRPYKAAEDLAKAEDMKEER